MTRHIPQILLVLLGATAITIAIAELRTMRATASTMVADAGTAASSLSPPAPVDPGPRSAPTIAASQPEPWERGEVIALGILGVYILASALARHDRKRAAIWTGVVTGAAGLVAAVAAGVTPTVPMILGALVAGGGIAAQSPLRPRAPRENESGSVTGAFLLALIGAVVLWTAGMLWSCSSTQRPAATGPIVDCSLVPVGNHSAKLETTLRAGDWTTFRAETYRLGPAVGGCSARAAIEAVLQQSVAPAPSDVELYRGWRRLKRDLLGGRRYLPEVR